MDAFDRSLEPGERPPRFHLSPYGHCPPLHPANGLETGAFDQSLNGDTAVGCIGMANGHHVDSVLPPAAPGLFPIAQDAVGTRETTSATDDPGSGTSEEVVAPIEDIVCG